MSRHSEMEHAEREALARSDHERASQTRPCAHCGDDLANVYGSGERLLWHALGRCSYKVRDGFTERTFSTQSGIGT